jgi:hypothetical protein
MTFCADLRDFISAKSAGKVLFCFPADPADFRRFNADFQLNQH